MTVLVVTEKNAYSVEMVSPKNKTVLKNATMDTTKQRVIVKNVPKIVTNVTMIPVVIFVKTDTYYKTLSANKHVMQDTLTRMEFAPK